MRRALVYLAIIFIGCLLGANVYNSVVDAPSWGANIPQSLETAQRYFATGNPGVFFRVASPLAQAAALLVLVVCWKLGSPVRWYAAGALALIVLVDGFTFAYFYPRNAIMFVPPTDAARASAAWREWSAMNHVRSLLALSALVCELTVLSRVERLQAPRCPGGTRVICRRCAAGPCCFPRRCTRSARCRPAARRLPRRSTVSCTPSDRRS